MTDPAHIPRLAERLTKRQGEILELLRFERKLGLATRREDRERQGLRRLGLIAYVGSPKRWQISASGLSTLAHLTAAQEKKDG